MKGLVLLGCSANEARTVYVYQFYVINVNIQIEIDKHRIEHQLSVVSWTDENNMNYSNKIKYRFNDVDSICHFP